MPKVLAKRGRPPKKHGNSSDFVLNASKYFLTYSQVGTRPRSPGIPRRVEDMITRLQPELQTWAGAKEFHVDGHINWHLILIFNRVVRTRDSKFFDIEGLHPNIRVILSDGDLNRFWESITKDRTAIRFGPWQGPDSEPSVVGPTPDPPAEAEAALIPQKSARHRAWAYIRDAPTRQEFERRCLLLDPCTSINNHPRLLAFADSKYPPRLKMPLYIPEYTYFPGVTREMWDWVTQHLHSSRLRPKSLILRGDGLNGKTQWARSLGPHSYMQGDFNIDNFDESSDYIVFDDISTGFTKMMLGASYTVWLGAQKNFTISDKYKQKKQVVWGKPAIWISNSDPFKMSQRGVNLDWIRMNSVTVSLRDRKLYVAPGDEEQTCADTSY